MKLNIAIWHLLERKNNNCVTCGIYKITNKINNKCYIGQSVNIETRWKHHKNNCFNKNEHIYDCHFYRSLRKYGIENFKFEIIEKCNQDKLNDREMYWISYYDSYKNGYNSTLGGDGLLQVDREEFKDYFLKNNPCVKEIADYFNINRSVASRIMKELGLKANYYVSKEKEEQICDYYLSDDNFSLLDVSNKFHIDRGTASRVLKRNGISVRKITTNSLNKFKKILFYDLDGNFIKESLLVDAKQWLYGNGYTKDKSCRNLMRCLKGEEWQAYGFIFRWYKENYPMKITKTEYWYKT